MRIFQLLDSLSYGDAIGNDALSICHILRQLDYDSYCYALHIDKRIPENISKPLSQLPALETKDIILYHAAIGSKLNFDIADMNCKKVMIYHNITPPRFFHNYSRIMETQTRSGYIGIKYLSSAMDYCIADSNYNKTELIRMGYNCPIDVCPIIIPFEDYDLSPSQSLLSKYQNDGWTNFLFVGRIAPNKCQEDIIRSFYAYQKKYNQKSRLFLIGNSSGLENYLQQLVAYTEVLGIKDKVIFPGHIRFDELLAYYRLADLFLCMSEHEGFCVPLLEAMHFHIPIVAFNSSAVPETLRDGGVLLDDKNPEECAGIIHYILTHADFSAKILRNQTEILKGYQYDTVRVQFEECINKIVERSAHHA